MRFNSGGIDKDDLGWMLKRPDLVSYQRRRNECFLCCAKGVNNAGLCEICMTYLSDANFELAQLILRGQST